MRIETIYEDSKMIVKAVWVKGEFFYTRTYWLDDEGYVEKDITVFYDGTLSEQ